MKRIELQRAEHITKRTQEFPKVCRVRRKIYLPEMLFFKLRLFKVRGLV